MMRPFQHLQVMNWIIFYLKFFELILSSENKFYIFPRELVQLTNRMGRVLPGYICFAKEHKFVEGKIKEQLVFAYIENHGQVDFLNNN